MNVLGCTFYLIFVSVFVLACDYDKNACEGALEAQQEHCEGNEDCTLCGCVTQGYFCAIEWEKMSYFEIGGIRLPDFDGPGVYCAKPPTCDENMDGYATSCLEEKDMGSCTPWIYYSPVEIYLCDSNLGYEIIRCE